MKQAAYGEGGAASRRAVVVHGRDHGLLALGVARCAPGRLLLVSAASAGCFMGPLWWASLTQSLGAGICAVGATDLLDCGASAGRCMEALRIGLRRLVLSPDCAQFETVRRRGEAMGAAIVSARPACLDLADHDRRRDRIECLQRWLRGEAAAP